MPCCSSPAKLSSPYPAVATLLLIENSASMSFEWPLLRDQYLPSVLRTLQGPISNATPSTFFIESSSLPSVPPQFKVYHSASCRPQFESDGTSRLSAEKIHSSIDLLSTIAIQTQPVALHLIIVAASAPLPNYQDSNHPTTLSTWLQLAERMTQESVKCHLIMKTDQDVSPFEILFEETLRLRSSCEAHLPSNINPTDVVIRLTEPIDFAQNTCSTVRQSGPYGQRSHQRLPLEPSNGKSYDSHCASAPQAQSEQPSLVAELQQRHGLTKKKVYGVKQPRTPFFRDDPPDPYRRPVCPLPPPLADLSLTTPITVTPGGRSAPLSRLDRWNRVSRRSLTDTSRRWYPSKVPSPDSSCSIVPSCMPPNNEPTVHTPLEMPYQPVTHLDQNGFFHTTTYESSMDAQWGTDPGSYVSQTTPVITQTPQAAYVQHVPVDTTYGHLQTPAAVGSPPASQLPTAPLIDHKPSGPACNELTSLKYDEPAPPSSSTSSSSPKAASTPKDDEPFTFDPAFIAATAVMFRQEVLPAYPELADSYVSPPKRRSGSMVQGYNTGCDHSILPYLPASKAGQLYAAKYSVAACQQQPGEGTSTSSLTASEHTHHGESRYYQYPPTYSVGTSSLIGWAG